MSTTAYGLTTPTCRCCSLSAGQVAAADGSGDRGGSDHCRSLSFVGEELPAVKHSVNCQPIMAECLTHLSLLIVAGIERRHHWQLTAQLAAAVAVECLF